MFVIWVLDRSCLCALKGNFAWRNAALLFGNHCSYYHGTWSGGSTKLFLFTLPVLQVSIIKCNSHFDAKANHIPKRIEHLMWQFHLFLEFFFCWNLDSRPYISLPYNKNLGGPWGQCTWFQTTRVKLNITCKTKEVNFLHKASPKWVNCLSIVFHE